MSSESSFEAPTLEALNQLLPAYSFDAFIAQGGMGAVYKARQIALDRDVAVKVLPRELGDDPDFRQSFETEAKAMGRLNHPNLIGVYDFGAIDGMLYIVMEYVNGKSLYHSAYNLAVDPEQAAAIVKGICDGLAHAHDNGVIHRDIKPANILLNEKVVPKIGDFGLARPHWAEGPGLIMGTPGYTAPEIYDNPEHCDRRTDIFAVGVILYELLTGQKSEEDSPPPSSVVHCDKRLDAIWRLATDPNPERRYETVDQMAHDLEAWANKLGETTTLRTMQRPPGRMQPVPIAHTAPRRRAPAPVVHRKKKGGTDWALLQHILIGAVVIGALVFLWNKIAEAKREHEKPPAPKEEAQKPGTPPVAPKPGTAPAKPEATPVPAAPPKAEEAPKEEEPAAPPAEESEPAPGE
jgi:serine/threonine protein kinase